MKPAFPTSAFRDQKGEILRDDILTHEKQEGMSLLDYFAAQALTGLLHAYLETDFTIPKKSARVATEAYNIAEAMIEESVARNMRVIHTNQHTGEPDPCDLAREYNEAIQDADQPTPYDP